MLIKLLDGFFRAHHEGRVIQVAQFPPCRGVELVVAEIAIHKLQLKVAVFHIQRVKYLDGDRAAARGIGQIADIAFAFTKGFFQSSTSLLAQIEEILSSAGTISTSDDCPIAISSIQGAVDNRAWNSRVG